MSVVWKKYGIDAVLWTGLCGMNGGRAVAEILAGTVNPSGKLPDTWSLTWEEIPSSRNFYQPETPQERISGGCEKYIDTLYEEGLYIGYRYFDTFKKKTAYSFGHGLSYTTFEFSARLAPLHVPGRKFKCGTALDMDLAIPHLNFLPGT